MKHFYLILSLLVTFNIFSQNKLANLFDQLDKSDMETQVLYQPLLMNNVSNFSNKNITAYNFLTAFNAISESDLQRRLPSLDQLKGLVNDDKAQNIVPIAILHSEFETISKFAMENGLIEINSENKYVKTANSGDIFERHELTLGATLTPNVKGLALQFRLASDALFNTTDREITSIKINFDDGRGFVSVNPDVNLMVNYSQDGVKNLKYKLHFSDGSVKSVQSQLEVKYSTSNLNTLFNRAVTPFTASITPNLSPYGEATSYPGQGEYEIFLGADGILDKPVILVDGFDPQDSRNITSLYNSLNYDNGGSTANLGDALRAEDFDLVLLNFPVYTRAADAALIDGGVDFIERNAMLLVDLINLVNTQKTGTEQNVVIGPSMGGLVARYALNYMENQTLDHDTRLYISLDSPHLGANVPIGAQHMFNYMAYGVNVAELQVIVDGLLQSSAARQMLTDHLESHLETGNTVEFDPAKLLPAAHPFRAIFMNNIGNLTTSGFPETVRNVSIINGSGIGNPYQDKLGNNIAPGFEVLNGRFTIESFAPTLKMYLTPATASGPQLVSSIVQFPIISSSAFAKANSYSDGIDAASGGLYDLASLGSGLDPMSEFYQVFAALKTDYFSFIPSVSAMALDNDGEIDWYHDIDLGDPTRTVSNSTPFDSWYMPDDNQEHVELTVANVAFAMDEIMQTTLGIGDSDLNNILQLEKNPITNQLVLLSSDLIQNAEITITDLTGKNVFTSSQNLESRTELYLPLQSGLYLLNIDIPEGGNFKTKVLVR